MSLILSVFGMTQAIHGDYKTAIFCLGFSGICDAFDGRVARSKKNRTEDEKSFGIQLDSLADIVTFGVAPSAMLFSMFSKVAYPAFMYSSFWFTVMPFTAFLIAAFSALRLAKFNIDERQHTGFIGMPTPANAIFWGAIITGSQEYLSSPRFNVIFLFAFMIMFCWLMVSEIRMFSLKFKNLSWEDNKVKYVFVLSAIIILLLSAGQSDGSTANTIQMFSRGVAGCIGFYILMSILTHFRRED
jgi:CDP-diacylglycerol--serine O-phosphatidyltransferase